MNKWDRRFLKLAEEVSTWSRDPSTQAGAVIVDQQHRVVSLGFNGFPVGVADDCRLADRQLKYRIIIHAEINAILFAKQPLEGCTLYLYPFLTCSNCASVGIQAGIKRVVAPTPTKEQSERWGISLSLSRSLFREAGVIAEEIEDPS